MSFLVELPEYAYDAHAFEDFMIDSKFRIGTARAMMWMSQLAYEVRGAHEKVEPVLGQMEIVPDRACRERDDRGAKDKHAGPYRRRARRRLTRMIRRSSPRSRTDTSSVCVM